MTCSPDGRWWWDGQRWAPAPGQDGGAIGWIELTAQHNPMALKLYLTTILVVVDLGQAREFAWGTCWIGVAPGQHRVDVSFSYVGGQIGHASTIADVADGVPARLVYVPPDWIWSSGHLRQVS